MNNDPPKSLFVTNLPYSLDLENFKSYFTKFGPVERFDIPDHPNKPIAFVHFQNADDAARCLKENDGILYQGKILCIKFSSKAKPEHAPPLPASVKPDSSEPSTKKPDSENFTRKRRHDNLYNDFDRRRNPSPDYEMDRRRDTYYRDRIYRDRISREPNIRDHDPPYYHDRDPDYYYDDYPRDFHGYHRRRRPVNDHRDRDIIQSYPERDFYDYDYNNQARFQSQPLQPHQMPQSQFQQNFPYNVPQNPQIVNSQNPSNSNQNPPLQLDQMNEMMQIDPRPQMMRSSQIPPPIPPPPPPPPPPSQARILPPSSSMPQPQPQPQLQPQQQQYGYNDNRYYTTYQ